MHNEAAIVKSVFGTATVKNQKNWTNQIFRATSSGRMLVELQHSRVISSVFSVTPSGSKDLIG